MFNWDKSHFGYYSVGDYRTFSKLESIEIATKTNQTVQWHFNDEVYSSQDWSQEPTESILDLYMERARQLRSKYEYLVMFYTGGSDSYNMLMSFKNARVKIDEICCLTYYQGDGGDKDSAMNKEIYESALPTAHYLKNNDPLFADTKITNLDITELSLNLFKRLSPMDYWYMANSSPSPWCLAKSYIREHVPYFAQLVANKKTAFVWGREKPQYLMFSQGKFVFRFQDQVDGEVTPRTQYLNKPEEHDEFFYFTPDLPKITIKQVHLIKNFFIGTKGYHEHLELENRQSYRAIGNFPLLSFHRSQQAWLTDVGLNKLIYPWYDNKLYSQPKPSNIILTPRDNWMAKYPEIIDPFLMPYNGILQNLGENWVTKHLTPWGEKRLTTRKFFSKDYKIPLRPAG
jgi:hypothetical protein